ncbi:histidine phosphatase family protein [Hamadaea sp. NPDC051192]|uniref:histidine phosphatase family protein n=1 Tax=Hamadaea sp. NPDC051192 TaxID=3154940 RepID=UPI0034472AAD
MRTRHLYLARHGHADALGDLTEDGRAQASLLGRRLAAVPAAVIWHSPVPRAVATARHIAEHLPDAIVAEADELADHVPYIPIADETPSAWRGRFDGSSAEDVADASRRATALLARFATAEPVPGIPAADTHEILISHAPPIAWLVRDALGAPPSRWLGLDSANTALTIVRYRTGEPPALVVFNDQSHLPPELRWTGFPRTVVQ